MFYDAAILKLVKSSEKSMTMRRPLTMIVVLAAFAWSSPALAQKVTTVEELTLKQTLVLLSEPLGGRPAGEAIGLATALEIGTTPFGTSSGGFVFKLDPATGLLARTSTTFGPSFTDRALTSGEGQVSVGAAFSASTYDKLSDFSLNALPLGAATATSSKATLNESANFDLTARILAISGEVGVTDNLDIGVIVPLISIKLEGSSSVVSGDGTITRLAATNSVFSGVGDIAALVKYRFFKFRGELPDPGGLAVVMNMRLPTGNSDNLLGLGVTRTLVSLVASGGTGRFRPHGNVGFEYWSHNVGIPTSVGQDTSVEARNQFLYAAGVEVEGTPKVTLLVDFIGQHINGAGQVGLVTNAVPANSAGVTSLQSLVGLGDGVSKALIVPGLKVNLKGKLLMSLNALMTLKNNGLHPTVTPVVGINLTL